MKKLIAILIMLLTIIQPCLANNVDYTSQNYTTDSCELFAKDVAHAADMYRQHVVVSEFVASMKNVPMAKSRKHRLSQAIDLVWDNQLDNPLLAYTIAMGLCLKPKQVMAPIDEPWVTSPRTNNGFY